MIHVQHHYRGRGKRFDDKDVAEQGLIVQSEAKDNMTSAMSHKDNTGQEIANKTPCQLATPTPNNDLTPSWCARSVT